MPWIKCRKECNSLRCLPSPRTNWFGLAALAPDAEALARRAANWCGVTENQNILKDCESMPIDTRTTHHVELLSWLDIS